jgi:hypothetical protein
VAGGVIVCLLILGAATAIAIVLVILLLRRRRQAGQKSFGSAGSFDNQLHERQMQSSVGSVNGNGIGLMPIGDTKGDLRDDGGSHEYAAVSADDAYYEDMKVSSPTAILDTSVWLYLYGVIEVYQLSLIFQGSPYLVPVSHFGTTP